MGFVVVLSVVMSIGNMVPAYLYSPETAVPPVPDRGREERPVREEREPCGFEGLRLPGDVAVYAAGGYAGRDAGFQIDQSGHEATRFDVTVNSRTRPVVLMLGAYEPTIWNLEWTEGTRILAVFASGYHRQVVAGLGDEVPLLVSTHDNRARCGYFRVRDEGNPELNPMARTLFGRPVELVYPGDGSGRIVVGAAVSPGQRVITSPGTTPESFRDPDAPLAGEAGLEAAVSRGVIRPATDADAVRWVAAVAANSPERDVPPVAGKGVPRPPRPRLHNAYVVMKDFTYPSGLYGANAATFFIERGVPEPAGDPGHSAVYDFNTLDCRGALCRH
ncbi:hypothetical protein NYO91_17445 [Arhodomonas aquaeolei]|uniref:hypothetical protein n=1 Tax=Arhodomonas aquaeolei TaxID=2369 RepID=UPI00216776D6|nr:hypothetical protein [Arhodomonas aquaeolei]MCS4505869.1 hypothetical protein [Arhodomonas aquaeolei]